MLTRRLGWILACVVAITGLFWAGLSATPAPRPARAAVSVLLTITPTYPPPHLRYGINIRDLNRLPLVESLGTGWVKLWETYSGLPGRRLPQTVLFGLHCGPYVDDLEAWRAHVAEVVTTSAGTVEAFEICNEPNLRPYGWGQVPDPARFTALLCMAYAEIKAHDPQVLVVSGGLAPVGRIPGTCEGWLGNDCNAMDEQLYLQAMLDYGAGACMDAFGYHPYGFAYPPEQDPTVVSNAFAFRGVELMREILVDHGLSDLPVWTTEFNWLRHPAEDGREACTEDEMFWSTFGWHAVSETTQADYLVRAFEYADLHWPWLEGMFVWNLDWHDFYYPELCEASQFFALRRYDGTSLGGATAAYDALAALEKRPLSGDWPRLVVSPTARLLLLDAQDLSPITTTFLITNAGAGVLTWTAQAHVSATLVPTLPITWGVQGETLPVIVDGRALDVGVYTGAVTVSATSYNVFDAPQVVTVIAQVITDVTRFYLPLVGVSD